MTPHFRTLLAVAFVGAVSTLSSVSHASLIDRGGGLIYDSALNVTWYDYSHGDGILSFQDQKSWVDSLEVTVRDKTITGWRLPTTSGQVWSYGYDGSTSAGLNIATSEMGSLYYSALGKVGAYDISGNYLNPAAWMNSSFLPFTNLKSGMYFSATPDPRNPTSHYMFSFYSGYQFSLDSTSGAYAMAVHDGDIAYVAAPVPEPETYAMMLAGLGLLGFVGRRKTA